MSPIWDPYQEATVPCRLCGKKHIGMMCPQPETIACFGCDKKIVYPPARVCTLCLLTGRVTERERAALEDGNA